MLLLLADVCVHVEGELLDIGGLAAPFGAAFAFAAPFGAARAFAAPFGVVLAAAFAFAMGWSGFRRLPAVAASRTATSRRRSITKPKE